MIHLILVLIKFTFFVFISLCFESHLISWLVPLFRIYYQKSESALILLGIIGSCCLEQDRRIKNRCFRISQGERKEKREERIKSTKSVHFLSDDPVWNNRIIAYLNSQIIYIVYYIFLLLLY
jgi:hypothetical protein